jgi:hypothetical protein
MRKGSFAGFGALAFAVLTFVAAIISNGPGGNYKESDVTDFLKSGHRPIVFVATYMVLVGVVGLVFLLARLRDAIADSTRSSVFWALGVAGVGTWIAGWALGAAAPIARGYGGKDVVIAPTVTYTLSSAGYIMLASGAVLIGLALLMLVASPAALPAWVRWFTLVGAAGAIASPAWFPFVLFYIWALVMGIWLLMTERSSPVQAA